MKIFGALFSLIAMSSSLQVMNHDDDRQAYSVSESSVLPTEITEKLRLFFEDDGTLDITGGCNFLSTQYNLYGNSFIADINWGSTRKFCQNDQDRSIQFAINTVTYFEKTDTGAVLSDQGKVIFVLQNQQ